MLNLNDDEFKLINGKMCKNKQRIRTEMLFQFQSERRLPWLCGACELCSRYSDSGLNKNGPYAKRVFSLYIQHHLRK